MKFRQILTKLIQNDLIYQNKSTKVFLVNLQFDEKMSPTRGTVCTRVPGLGIYESSTWDTTIDGVELLTFRKNVENLATTNINWNIGASFKWTDYWPGA